MYELQSKQIPVGGLVDDKMDSLPTEKVKWMEGILSNDEGSTDVELVGLFVQNGVDEAVARQWVEKRTEYLNGLG